MNPCRLSPLIQRGILSWSISAEMGENVENSPVTSRVRLKTLLLTRLAGLRQSENQIFLVLAIVIGALTGFAVAAFIVLTERFGMRLYPVGGAPWRRLLFPVAGSLIIGYLLYRYFPNARGSGGVACGHSGRAIITLAKVILPVATISLPPW